MKNQKEKNKILLITIIVVILLAGIIALLYQNNSTYKVYYDLKSSQKKITSKAEIDSIFSRFKIVPYNEMEQSYLTNTKSYKQKYRSMLRNKKYYVLEKDDLFKYIAGGVRIKDLLPKKDIYYKECIKKNKNIYWLIDKRVIYKLLELQLELEKMGYDPDGFTVRNGYRYPSYNEKIGGASRSRHIVGEAIDITVGDIDKNGKYQEEKDKKIVLDLLTTKILKNTGGIGKYPGTRSVHFDVRSGKNKRWDSY